MKGYQGKDGKASPRDPLWVAFGLFGKEIEAAHSARHSRELDGLVFEKGMNFESFVQKNGLGA